MEFSADCRELPHLRKSLKKRRKMKHYWERRGHTNILTFKHQINQQLRNRNRKRKITLFNPLPKVVNIFLGWLQSTFQNCGFRNLRKKINTREFKMEAHNSSANSNACNCRDKRKCPLDGSCNMEVVIYKAQMKGQRTDEGLWRMHGRQI